MKERSSEHVGASFGQKEIRSGVRAMKAGPPQTAVVKKSGVCQSAISCSLSTMKHLATSLSTFDAHMLAHCPTCWFPHGPLN